jgi:two-component system response regulator RegA
MSNRRLLLVDDDATFCEVLQGALQRRGFEVYVAKSARAALELADAGAPAYAVVDLRMPDESGLFVVKTLAQLPARPRIVVLTGFASIATAVEAIKLGAIHYLTKPVEVDELVAAFGRVEGDIETVVAANPLSVNRLEWEHLQRVLLECKGNISAAARRMSMHRRTLQRKLNKRPVKH